DSQTVAEPLNRGARDEDAPLERVARLAPRAAGNRRQEPAPRPNELGAGVEQEEATRPVGVLESARLDAALTEERRLLVPRDPEHRHVVGEPGNSSGDA